MRKFCGSLSLVKIGNIVNLKEFEDLMLIVAEVDGIHGIGVTELDV